MGKKKPKSLEPEVKQPIEMASVQQVNDPPMEEERQFVQTIQIPKPGSVHRKAKRRPGTRKTPGWQG